MMDKRKKMAQMAKSESEKIGADMSERLKKRDAVYVSEANFARVICMLLLLVAIVSSAFLFTASCRACFYINGAGALAFLLSFLLFAFKYSAAFTVTRAIFFFFSGAYAAIFWLSANANAWGHRQTLWILALLFTALLTLRMPRLMALFIACCALIFYLYGIYLGVKF